MTTPPQFSFAVVFELSGMNSVTDAKIPQLRWSLGSSFSPSLSSHSELSSLPSSCCRSPQPSIREVGDLTLVTLFPCIPLSFPTQFPCSLPPYRTSLSCSGSALAPGSVQIQYMFHKYLPY